MMDADDPQRQYSQISPNFKLQKIEMWVPIGFGLISLGLYIGLIVAGFFGPDYYRVRSEKEQEATFFEEEIKDDTTYALLILLSAGLGFMRAVFDAVAGPQWSRLVTPTTQKPMWKSSSRPTQEKTSFGPPSWEDARGYGRPTRFSRFLPSRICTFFSVDSWETLPVVF